MKRLYSITPRNAAITVEGRSPFDAERRARREHPHLQGEDLLVVAATLAWERESDPYSRSHPERLDDFHEQAEEALWPNG